ncbi:hypothetical protein [Photobacterium atrarenae]|uniref:Transporter n=1 Tax=Photobacterium atrarenae TaxID=865757 RepID=A0ABY5GBF0_9GAMM|nr:hypothetical protein [Photobacterium atrarenae]UTV26505.1 hypothetical protein NNL38_08950 [Photobacterium atrarenae]
MDTPIDISKDSGVVFNYTLFLSASCQYRLTFIDALKALIPSLTVSWTSALPEGMSESEKLQTQALKVLSTSTSDTNNLIRLIRLARQERIQELLITLPYALDVEQLDYIEEKAECKIILAAESGEVLRAMLCEVRI